MTDLCLTHDLDADANAQADDAAIAVGAGQEGALDGNGFADAGGADATFSSEHASGGLDAGGGLAGSAPGDAAADQAGWASLEGAFEGWTSSMGHLFADLGGSLSAMLGF